jgi:pimeloyl-ACP methyl ester carboxylesterase
MKDIFYGKHILWLFIGTIVTLTGVITQPVHAANPAYGSCQTVTLPVAMTSASPKNQTIVGDYCTPTAWASGTHQLDIMVAGATYNRQYWDWPVEPATYSYVDKTLQAGRATFAYDHLGKGDSSKPSGLALTITVDSYVLHQVIQYFRSTGYAQTNVIGHSMGSMAAIENDAIHPGETNRLVVTGFIHLPALSTALVNFFAHVEVAALDPQFIGKITDPTYLTTGPGSRQADFYSSSADPAVVAYDEAHKDTVSAGEATEFLDTFEQPSLLNLSKNVTAPTMVVVGRQDALLCGLLVSCTSDGSILANEAPYYPSAANLTVKGIDSTGHDVALHPSADTSFALINQWLQTQ